MLVPFPDDVCGQLPAHTLRAAICCACVSYARLLLLPKMCFCHAFLEAAFALAPSWPEIALLRPAPGEHCV